MSIISSLAPVSFPDGLSGFHAAQHIIMRSTVVVCCCLAMLRHVLPRLYVSYKGGCVVGRECFTTFQTPGCCMHSARNRSEDCWTVVGRRGSFCCQHHNCAYVFCLFLFGGQQQRCSYRCLAGLAITLGPYPLQLVDTTYLSCTPQPCVAHT